MLESELFALLEQTGDAAYTVTAEGTVSHSRLEAATHARRRGLID